MESAKDANSRGGRDAETDLKVVLRAVVDPVSDKVLESLRDIDDIFWARANEVGDLLGDDGVLAALDHVDGDGGRDSPGGLDGLTPRLL